MTGNEGSADNRFGRAKHIAVEIAEEARVQLMMKFRFLDVAVWKMELRPVMALGRYTFATDGTHVYYEPYTVIGRFDASFDEVVRDYLHVVMHCLFRHPYDATRTRTDAWWLACDVLAESAAMDLCGKRFASELDGERRMALEELKGLCGGKLTPGNLYGLFLRSLRAAMGATDGIVTGARMNELRALFGRDGHESWPAFRPVATPGAVEDSSASPDDESGHETSDGRDMMPEGEADESDVGEQDVWNPNAAGESDEGREGDHSLDSDDQEAEGSSEDASDIGDNAEDAHDAGMGDWGGSADDDDSEQSVDNVEADEERSWEEIAKQVEMDLETFSQEWGCEAGGFMTALAVANRKKYDYADFLRRFTMLSEEMKINDDEFDYVFYTYGLALYGNMPLIEPLEYKETQRIRDFAICIDTSESCKGELVRLFVEHTFNIMKQQEDYAHAVNIHVIQCDARVQSDLKIADLRDVDRFMESFEVRGLGGTDFRPAFAHVNSLRDSGELADLKGLIYFTDGLGDFPEKPPDYDVAFVFMDEGDNYIPDVPPWAMRVLVDEEGINRFRKQ
jgi:predicted metal-dependent peptidase